MKSAILYLLIMVSLAFSLYGNDDLVWDSGSPAEPTAPAQAFAKADTVSFTNLNSFSSRTEYARLNVNDKHSESSFFTTNSLTIPMGRFEAILNIDKYDFDVFLEYFDDAYERYTIRNATIELMGRYRLIKGWKLGLGAI